MFALYRFVLHRTGGPHDRGVDFRGFWRALDNGIVPVIGQCKCQKKRVGPDAVRELHATASTQYTPNLALLVSASGFTSGAINTSRSLGSAVVLCTVQWTDTRKEFELFNSLPTLSDFLMNTAAQRLVPWVTVGSTHQFQGYQRKVTLLAFDGQNFKELTHELTPS
jgi:hypothetical protein